MVGPGCRHRASPMGLSTDTSCPHLGSVGLDQGAGRRGAAGASSGPRVVARGCELTNGSPGEGSVPPHDPSNPDCLQRAHLPVPSPGSSGFHTGSGGHMVVQSSPAGILRALMKFGIPVEPCLLQLLFHSQRLLQVLPHEAAGYPAGTVRPRAALAAVTPMLEEMGPRSGLKAAALGACAPFLGDRLGSGLPATSLPSPS